MSDGTNPIRSIIWGSSASLSPPLVPGIADWRQQQDLYEYGRFSTGDWLLVQCSGSELTSLPLPVRIKSVSAAGEAAWPTKYRLPCSSSGGQRSGTSGGRRPPSSRET